MKTAMVLEGGAMRGMFTAGVLDVLMENNITTDVTIGVSAGAAFGSNFKSGQIGRSIRYNLRFCRDKRYCSIWSLLFTGNLYGAKFCYHTLPNKLDVFDTEAFEKSPMEFYVVCTDVETGKPLYKKIDKADDVAYEWFRASASLPLVSEIVELEDKKLLDGGISDSIPLKFAESIGCDKSVVILTQPKGYTKKPASMMGIMERIFKKYPKMIEALKNRYIMYNDTLKYIEEKEREGSVLVIRPKESLIIKRVEHKRENLEAVYKLGREIAQERLEEIIKFLSE
ncbi:MAG: patatin family protein [Ruminococcaceae bacterium]|nr:patatin family protein [Oscillospiraceae bacterium]